MSSHNHKWQKKWEPVLWVFIFAMVAFDVYVFKDKIYSYTSNSNAVDHSKQGPVSEEELFEDNFWGDFPRSLSASGASGASGGASGGGEPVAPSPAPSGQCPQPKKLHRENDRDAKCPILPGYYCSKDKGCTRQDIYSPASPCEAGYYCTGGQGNRTACVPNRNSTAKAKTMEGCYANEDYYGKPDNTAPIACPVNSNTLGAMGAREIDDCFCQKSHPKWNAAKKECEAEAETFIYSWKSSSYGRCSAPCQKAGKAAPQKIRTVYCEGKGEDSGTTKRVPAAFCTGGKPAASAPCNAQTCTEAQKMIKDPCEGKLCAGNGLCVRDTQNKTNGICVCRPGYDPATDCSTKSLVTQYAWKTGKWGDCSKKCDGGTSTRETVCYGFNANWPEPKKATTQDCTGTEPAATRVCNDIKCDVPKLEVEMKVEIDFDSVTASAEMQKAFEETFSGEIADALGLPSDRVVIVSLTKGSVDVKFEILPDPTSTSAANAATNLNKVKDDLVAQASNPESKLKTQGTYARLASAPKVKTVEPESKEEATDGLGGGAIAAIVIGILVSATGVWWLYNKKSSTSEEKSAGNEAEMTDMSKI